MNPFPSWLAPVVLALGVASCAQMPTRPSSSQSVPPPADTGDRAADLVYHSLAADIAARRGLLDDAFGHYIWLARETRDAEAAEKAARIGLHLKKNGETLAAATLWAGLAPEDLGAQEVKAALYLGDGQEEEAYSALQAMVRLAEAQGKRGFVEAAGVVSTSDNRALGRQLMARLARDNQNDADARYAHSLVLLAFGDLAGAEGEARAAVSLAPKMELAWVLLSRIRTQLGDAAGAGEVFKEAVRRNPDSRVLRISYARWLVEADRYEGAVDQFQHLLRMTPDDPDVLFSLGALSTDLKRWRAARGYWNRLLKMNERVDEARYFLAEVESATGNADGALALYRRVQSGPLRMEAAVRVAEILAERGEMDESRRVMAGLRVLFADRAVSLYLLEAEILRNNGRPDEAAQVYETANRAFPDDMEILYARAMHATAQHRLGAAESDLRAIIEKDPEHVDALNALGYTLADQTDRYQEALKLISRALALKPENAAILDSMGWVQYRLGNLDAALDYLRRAAAKDDDVEIAAHLGEVLWVSGQRKEALKVWQDALDRDPSSAHVKDAISRLRGTP